MTMDVLATLKTLLSPLGAKDAAAPTPGPQGSGGSIDFATLLMSGASDLTAPVSGGLPIRSVPADTASVDGNTAVVAADPATTPTMAAIDTPVAAPTPTFPPEFQTPSAKAIRKGVQLPDAALAADAKLTIPVDHKTASEPKPVDAVADDHDSELPAPATPVAATDAPLPLPSAQFQPLPAVPSAVPATIAPDVPGAAAPAVATIASAAPSIPRGAPLGTAVNEPVAANRVTEAQPHPVVASAKSPATRQFTPLTDTSVAVTSDAAAPAVAAPVAIKHGAPLPQVIPSSTDPLVVPSAVNAQPKSADQPVGTAQVSAPAQATTSKTAQPASTSEVPASTIRQLRAGIPSEPGEATALLKMLSEVMGGRSVQTVPASASTAIPMAAAQAPASAQTLVAAQEQAMHTPKVAIDGGRPLRGVESPKRKDAAPTEMPMTTSVLSTRPKEAADQDKRDIDVATTEPVEPSAATTAFAPIRVQTAIQPAQGQPLDVGATLGQQVIDMSSGSQWIDSLAREIATIAGSDGQGSFRLSPENLGPMRVDIHHGDQGAEIKLTVETDAAQQMLQQDSGKLKADAHLAAVRIADVVVERAHHVAEPARSDAPTSQGNGGQQPQGQTGAQSTLAQGQGQSQPHAQPDRKTSGNPAVLNHAEPQDQAVDGDDQSGRRRARYA